MATDPAVGLVHNDLRDNPDSLVWVSITGAGFGLPVAGSSRECGSPAAGSFLQFGDGTALATAASTDPDVVVWRDKQIVIRRPATSLPTQVQVCTPAGMSAPVRVEYYTYEHFDVPGTPGTNPAPLAVATDAAQRVWVNEEFHLALKYLDAVTGRFTQLDIPRPPDPGPFAITLFGDARTQISAAGEAVTVDSRGRVWFTEGGTEPYSGAYADHSRVISYDPNAAPDQRFRVYNVPGDHNGVIGVAWDDRRQRVWFTEVARLSGALQPVAGQRARLVSFDPERIPFDNDFDFASTATCIRRSAPNTTDTCSNAAWRACLADSDCILADQICPPDAPDDRACYHEYELPPEAATYMPAHVAVHPDGSIWYTSNWGGNHIGRLDPESGRFTIVPLPEPIWKRQCDYQAAKCFTPAMAVVDGYCCQLLLFGTGPWDIKVAPSRDVVFTEYFNSALGRFRFSSLGDPRCESLDPSGSNPCVDQLLVPGVDLPAQQVHSVAPDRDGKTWFTQGGLFNDPQATTSLGYVKPDWSAIVLLPPLSLYPFLNTDGSYCPGEPGDFVSFTGGGIAIDPVTQDVWFADFCRKRLGRLHATARLTTQ